MATITTPSAGDAVTATWGSSVADAINNTHDDKLPFVNAMGLHQSTNKIVDLNLDAVSSGNSGAVIIPFWVPMSMDLVGYAFYNAASATQREAEFRLYKDTGSTTLEEVADSDATASYTPSAQDIRHITLTGGNLAITPGMYWLAIRNTDTTDTFKLGCGANTADWSDDDNYMARTYSTCPALGATLDVSSFNQSNRILMARLEGAVFGESTRF